MYVTEAIFCLIIQVNGQHYSDDSGVSTEDLDVVWRDLINSENLKYEMHKNALENVLQKILAARESDYYESLDDDDENVITRRSIAMMAKNGQLPSKQPDTEMGEDDNGHKRNLASMARSGLLGGKRNIQSIARKWNYVNGKRNIGSIKQQFPGKRNMASLARNFGKRNVGALARDWALPKITQESKYMDGQLIFFQFSIFSK